MSRKFCILAAVLFFCVPACFSMEKIEIIDLEPYFIDRNSTSLILELPPDYDDPVTVDTKVITDVGGISVPDTEYAQTMIKKFLQQFMAFYGHRNLQNALERGSEYRVYIRRKLKERNLPVALEYLPVIESEYRTNAVSRSGAKGLWQFMENSMKPFLVKSVWLDERLDPWKSTDAALAKLEENYRTFGDWTLAIAAYNCGSGAMTRALAAAKEKNFWYLAEHKMLKAETIQYIPKFIAACELVEHKDFYSQELPVLQEDEEPTDFDYVTVKGAVSVAMLTSEMELDTSVFKELNPSLTKAVTPPQAEYVIRLPSGSAESCELALEKIKKKSPVAGLRTHTIKQGDTLWSLSRKSGCSVEDLCALNNRSNNAILKIGDVLVLP